MDEVEHNAMPQDLSRTEERVWKAFRLGEECDLSTRGVRRGTGTAEGSGSGDGGSGDGGERRADPRTVRAWVLARLLLAGPEAKPGRVAALKLRGAHITGPLNLAGGQVRVYVQLETCRFDSEVRLPQCHLAAVRLKRCVLPRFEAARVAIDGDLHLGQCTIPGGVRLTDAHIGTDLLLSRLTVGPNRNGRSLDADGLAVGQDLDAEFLDSTGEISLRSARIGGRFSMRGSSLRQGPDGRYALNAARITVEHELQLSSGYSNGRYDGGTPPDGLLTQPFECEGAVRLDDGRFGNALVVNKARFTLTGDQQVSLRRVQTPELRFVLGARPEGGISLAGARVGRLTDSAGSWPAEGRIDLRGFSYDALISDGDFPLPDRIAWIHRATREYSPEPYEKLAQALRDGGEDTYAREVLLARQRKRRETLSTVGKVWGYLQDATVGYGYRPGRAALWMAALWALSALYFSVHGQPAPVDSQAWPQWNPALFALDLLLPVIDLGQSNAWRLAGAEQWVATSLTLLGWVLASTVATGASRLLRRG